jgi:MarR family transcriptional regulator, negative regulator of the multidrug operon emrRAB
MPSGSHWQLGLDTYILNVYYERMDEAQIANLLGALSLELSDAQELAAQDAASLGTSACAALVSLGPYPGTTVGELAKVLSLSHSVTVRLVDGLVEAGLVARKSGEDRRFVKLRLTSQGASLRHKILAARASVLSGALALLNRNERAQLGQILARLLTGLTQSREQADHICRLCDEDVCPDRRCPVECKAVSIAGAA